jgi:Kyakuja-Dileera-Zisupton transposase
VFCGRHGLARKNGLGNLQKGERYDVSSLFQLVMDPNPYNSYANMDFIVFYTLLWIIMTPLVVSYDIACQWSRNLRSRMLRLPQEMRISPLTFATTRFFIPKLHIYGHGDKCQYEYSFNFQKWSARTDGEDPERFWSHINPASMSTKEMSPGARFDALDSHAAHWNWRKITKMGMSVCLNPSKV